MEPSLDRPLEKRSLFAEMNGYHWWVFIAAALGWVFDCMDQRLFVLARGPAMRSLLPAGTPDDTINFYGGVATAVFLIGWGTGGLIFGVLGDRLGRVRTMIVTILLFSIFTGLSALSQNVWDFMVYRFLTGMGVGGEFAAGVTLLAEVMPPRVRPYALGSLQALSAIGNIGGATIFFYVQPVWGWKAVFLVGVLPAFLAAVFFWRLKEPETWIKARDAAKAGTGDQLGKMSDLLTHQEWRKHTIIGVLLAVSGVVGLWGIAFWSPELTRGIATRDYMKEHGIESREAMTEVQKTEANKLAQQTAASAMVVQDIGSFLGIWAFTTFAARRGRRFAFMVSFIAAWASAVMVFGFMEHRSQIWWMIPLLGFGSLSVFGGYAIYFAELFSTRLRSTGTGFCYNVARYLAAAGPFTLGALVGVFRSSAAAGDNITPLRYAACVVATIYLVGLLVLPFAPETKDKPLPE